MTLPSKDKLRSIVEGSDTRLGRAFDLAVIGLVLAALVVMAVATVPGLFDETRTALRVFEKVALGLFAAEYVLRMTVAEKPIRYATSFLGVVDLLSVLPALIGVFNSQGIRALRLLRLVRLLKLARYNAAVQRLHIAVRLAWEEMVLFFAASLILLFVAAAGIYEFEHEAQPEAFASIFHAMWWATATLTTVGYGDVYPITPAGKAFTFLVLVVGLGVVAMPAGLIASALTRARELQEDQDPNSSGHLSA